MSSRMTCPRSRSCFLAGTADAGAAPPTLLSGRTAGRGRAGYHSGARSGSCRGNVAVARVGRPVAAPSANRSGRVSPTSARHVLDGLANRIDAVLDSGPCKVGIKSTVLDLSGPNAVLLRPGGVTVEDLEGSIGPVRRGMPHSRGDFGPPA